MQPDERDSAYLWDMLDAARTIAKLTAELGKMKAAIKNGDGRQIEKLLETARNKRNKMIAYKMKNKEIIS